MHDHAVNDLWHRVHHDVEVAGPETNTTTIQRRIRTPRDLARSIVEERDPVAVVPDTRERLEVGAPISLTGNVAPQADRHRRHRRCDHEFASLARCTRRSVGSKCLHVTAEHASTDLTCPDRQHRRRADKGRAHVGATAHRPDLDVSAHSLWHPFEPLDRQGRSGRPEMPHTGQIQLVAWADALFAARHHKRGTDSTDVDLFIGGHPP